MSPTASRCAAASAIEGVRFRVDHRCQVPGVDDLAVDRGVAADCVEPGAIRPGWGERVACQHRIEPRDSTGGAFETCGDRRLLGEGSGDIMHQNSRARPSSRTFWGQLGAISAVTGRRSESENYRTGTTRASAKFLC